MVIGIIGENCSEKSALADKNAVLFTMTNWNLSE